VPRSAQGRPVLIQAGQSGRGRSFAGRWGELIFVVYPNMAAGQKQYGELKAAVAASGRNPDEVSVCPACYVCVADSQSAAEEKREYIRALAKPIDALVLLSEALNFDFGSKDMDSEFTDEELKKLSWAGFKERVVALSGKPNPTVREFVHFSGRGTIGEFPIFCGTPGAVADQMEEWFTSRACDGFVLAATHSPGAFEDFSRYVVPELQRRGLYHKDYAGPTLRENLGLPRPAIGSWRSPSLRQVS
jgi:alkanesulfonate monooxygenase SsuD/methylene tetrahydromethanopterin reductase-like flavin-dependent oxidoreductase (luciferase family)